MKRIKIIQLIPVWRRPHILNLFLKHLRRNPPDYADVMPVFITSPEDPDAEAIAWLLRREKVFQYKNQPLGEKMNAGINFIRSLKWDYLMNIGSDNIYTALLWELYREPFGRGAVFFGINDFHCMNYHTGEIALIRGYNTGPDDQPAPIGAGRMIARSILPGDDIYRKEWMWGMDGCSMYRLWQDGHKAEVIETNGRPVMLNVMTLTNLTQWVELQGLIPCNRLKMRAAFGLDAYRVVEVGLTLTAFADEVTRRVSECGSRRAAFEMVNEEVRQQTGQVRYKNYQTFRTAIFKTK